MITSAKPEPAAATVQLHHRGQFVKDLLTELPEPVMEQVHFHVEQLKRSKPASRCSLAADIMGLLNWPAVRRYVLANHEMSSDVRWAAVTSRFVAHVRTFAPDILGDYICDLVPHIARMLSPVVGMFRMGAGNEFRQAVCDSRQEHLRLSVLGPLSMFFLESVAGASLAWDVLVGPDDAPAVERPFGWAPSVDSLSAALRMAILGQMSRSIKRKALIYSPLGRYLMGQGLLHRVPVSFDSPSSGADSNSLATAARDGDRSAGRWLLSEEYLMQCGSACAISPSAARRPVHAAPWEADQVIVDRRTGRTAMAPDDELELIEIRHTVLACVKKLLDVYNNPARRQSKRLALWAYAAKLDPTGLVDQPQALEDETLAALAEVLLSPRLSGHRVDEANQVLEHQAPNRSSRERTQFTAAQLRTYLSRLRSDFRGLLPERL